MKQAILVMNNGGFNLLRKTIELLDDEDIDFYIYSNNKNLLTSKKSNLFFVGGKKANSQTYDELKVEKKLISEAVNGNYDYFHLIASDDYPLMTKEYFKNYFQKKPIKIGFVESTDVQDFQSLSNIYPFNNFNYENTWISFPFVKICMIMNKILGIKRIQKKDVIKGCPYFSLPREYVKKLNETDISIYKHTINPKNFFAQTALSYLKPTNPNYTIYSSRYNLMKAYKDSARYSNYLKTEKINWFDEKAYKFSDTDDEELKKVVNTDYAFLHSAKDSAEMKLF